MILIKLFLK